MIIPQWKVKRGAKKVDVEPAWVSFFRNAPISEGKIHSRIEYSLTFKE